ncbi:MAG TPA: tetratricopeptide repeat protein [Patescibacteria group bacterium]|nr:tetratricopeptide repeat protein [Patescibacteria group bacterium]
MTDSLLPATAVAAALSQNWKEALRINLSILKEIPDDVEALSRLAYAYTKTGQLTLAKKTYEKILDIDQYNQIAQKNIKKLATIKKKDVIQHIPTNMSPMIFLEEPGKTKIAECIHIAPTQLLSTLSAGQEVVLKPKNHCVEIRSLTNVYLAALPDDLSFKMNKLIAAGNTYQVVVKSVDKNSLKVLIRELTRGKRFATQPSFINTTSYIPFSRGVGQDAPEGPDMTPTGEDGDAEAPEE